MLSQFLMSSQLMSIVVAAASLFAVIKPAPPPVRVNFQGTVAVVMGDHLLVAARNERRTFTVAANAVIYVNRAEANLDDVMPGQFASVSGSVHGGELRADFISTRRQY